MMLSAKGNNIHVAPILTMVVLVLCSASGNVVQC
jgi:hypothetical protein